MFQILKDQSTADRRRIPILFVDATDGYTPETGVTSPTINISKNGGPFAAGAGTFTQIDATNLPGHYYYQFTTGEIDTLGYISFYAIKSGTTRSYNAVVQVMAYDEFSATNLGLSNLDATVGSRSTLTAANVNTEVDTALADVGLTTTVTGRIDTNIGSRSTLTAANVWDYLTSAATVVGSLGKRIADNLDVVVSTRSTLSAANVWDYLTSAATVVGSLGKRIADNLDALISTRSTLTTAQVNTEVDTALADVGLTTTVTGRIDTNIGSRMATFTYTTPPTAGTIADAVWDEPANDHTAGNSTGKVLDLIKKANYVTETQVTADITATTTTFSVALLKPTDYFNEQVLIFTTGALTGESKAIRTWTNNGTYSTIVLQEPLSAAPASGMEFVITSQQIHAREEIAETIWNTVRATSSPTGGIPAAGTYGRFLDAQVSAAGGGGGSSTVINGPYKIKSENYENEDSIDLLVGSTSATQIQAVNEEGIFVPISASNTNAVKIYNSAGTLVENLAVTVRLASNGIVEFTPTTATTNTAGTYNLYLESVDGSGNTWKFGPMKVYVKAL